MDNCAISKPTLMWATKDGRGRLSSVWDTEVQAMVGLEANEMVVQVVVTEVVRAEALRYAKRPTT